MGFFSFLFMYLFMPNSDVHGPGMLIVLVVLCAWVLSAVPAVMGASSRDHAEPS